MPVFILVFGVDVIQFGGVLWMRALGPSQTALLARAATLILGNRARRNFAVLFYPFCILLIFVSFFVERSLEQS